MCARNYVSFSFHCGSFLVTTSKPRVSFYRIGSRYDWADAAKRTAGRPEGLVGFATAAGHTIGINVLRD